MKKLLILVGLSAALSGCAVVPYQSYQYQDSPRTVVTTQYDNGSYDNSYSVVNRYYEPYPNYGTYGYAPLYTPFIYPSLYLNFSNRSWGGYGGRGNWGGRGNFRGHR